MDKFLEEKNDIKEYTRKEKHWVLLVSLDHHYYDGVSLTYSQTFKQKFDLPKESICNIKIFSEKRLDKIMIKKSSTYFPIILNDRTLLQGFYEYIFTYNDGTPFMEFPECLSCNDLDLSIIIECEQDPDIDIRIEYKIILLNDDHWKKTTVCYNVHSY